MMVPTRPNNDSLQAVIMTCFYLRIYLLASIGLNFDFNPIPNTNFIAYLILLNPALIH